MADTAVLTFNASRVRAIPFVVIGGSWVYVLWTTTEPTVFNRALTVAWGLSCLAPVLQFFTLRLRIDGDQLARRSLLARGTVTLSPQTELWVDDVLPAGPPIHLVRIRSNGKEIAFSPLLFSDDVRSRLLEELAVRTASVAGTVPRRRPRPPRRRSRPAGGTKFD